MNQDRAPLIAVGQTYLNADVNEYLIVTKKSGDEVSYAGLGFRGMSEDETFIERFQPVDPADISDEELRHLLSLCPEDTFASTGFILED